MNDWKRLTFALICWTLAFSPAWNLSREASAQDANVSTKTKFRLKLLWEPQTQFAGFYVAQRDDLYRQSGVDLELVHSSASDEIFDDLRNDRVDFVLSWSTSALKRHGEGDDVVNIGQFAQASSLMWVARKSSGISNFSDFSGKRLGIWPSLTLRAPLLYGLQKHNVQDYRILPTLTSVDLFLYGAVDATAAMYYNEYYRILASGVNDNELLCFWANEDLPHLADDGLYCKRSTFEKYPEVCEAIRRATLEGWRRAFENEAETLRETEKICDANETPFNLARQRWGLRALKQTIFPENKENDGFLSRESFNDAVSAIGISANAVQYEDFVAARKGEQENAK